MSHHNVPASTDGGSQLDLLDDKDCSDITVHCGDKVWHCQRAILCSRCPPLKNLIETDGTDQKITFMFSDNSVAAIQQLLTYIYSLDTPKLLHRLGDEYHELERNELWVAASQALLNGANYQLEPLKTAGLDAVLTQAPKLCREWDRMDEDTRRLGLDMISEAWSGWNDTEVASAEVTRVRLAILKGLVRYTAKIVDDPILHDLLVMNERFMLDYVWALSYRLGVR